MAAATDDDKTGKFDLRNLSGKPCPDCGGTGELRIDSENINEKFEVEKQTVITQCARCAGTGYVAAG
jgi:DnaJ-class molecular chaperone